MIAFITVIFLLLFYIVMLVSEVPFFLVVISGIPFALFVYFGVFALDFNESRYPRYCYLSYKQFKHFRLVNPSRFIYNEDGNKLYFRDNSLNLLCQSRILCPYWPEMPKDLIVSKL